MSDKLLTLTEQASPGPWDATATMVCGDPHGFAGEEYTTVLAFCEAVPEAEANAKLASLATHLLPLVEALEAVANLHWSAVSRNKRRTLETPQWKEGYQMLRDVRESLKALEDAL